MPTLTKEQQDIVNDNSQKIVVAAGPGAGKTSILIAKINSTIQNIKNDPNWWLTYYQKPPVLFISKSQCHIDDLRFRLTYESQHSICEIDQLLEATDIYKFVFKILIENDLNYIAISNHWDILKCWLHLLNDKKILKKIRNQYQLLLVDDFQYFYAQEIELIYLLSKTIDQAIITGNDSNNIHKLQGSDLKGLKYIKTLLSAKRYQLI